MLGAIAAVIFVFASHRDELRGRFYQVLTDLQLGTGSGHAPSHGILHEIERAFSTGSGTLRLVGAVFIVYALVEGIEAYGLWYQYRWAEYLTFLVTASLLPLEGYELAQRLSALKIVTIVINLAVVGYLLYAKRLFGLRGGVAAENASASADVGWPALERSSPEAVGAYRSADAARAAAETLDDLVRRVRREGEAQRARVGVGGVERRAGHERDVVRERRLQQRAWRPSPRAGGPRRTSRRRGGCASSRAAALARGRRAARRGGGGSRRR